MDDLASSPAISLGCLFTLAEPDEMPRDTLRRTPPRALLRAARRTRSVFSRTTTRNAPSTPARLSPRLAVLVIEQDSLRRVELSRALLQRHCDVVSCRTPAEAEEHLWEPTGVGLDAIVADLDLSGSSAVVRLLRERNEQVALICWTAAIETVAVSAMRETGVTLTGIVPRSRTGREVALAVRSLALRG
jgi:PleD family two-component response regulator